MFGRGYGKSKKGKESGAGRNSGEGTVKYLTIYVHLNPAHFESYEGDMKVKLVLDYCHWDEILAEVLPICSVDMYCSSLN